MTAETPFTPLMLTVVRESRKMSQTKLSEESGVSQPAISQYEANIITPGDDVVAKLAAALRCPPSLLCMPLHFRELPLTFFRKRASVRVKDVKAIRGRVNLFRLRVEALLRSYEISDARLLVVDGDAEGVSPPEAAQRLRVYWNVAPGPIPNLTSLIESNGVIVIPMDFGNDSVDAISMYEPADTLPPIIFISQSIPADRWRFSLAHELGHIVLHHHLRIPPAEEEMEEEANEFAAELLMPRREIAGQLRQLDMRKLAALKLHWRVAMGALLMRAKNFGYVSRRQERNLWMRLRRGGAKREPVEIEHEEAQTIRSMIEYHTDKLGYSVADLSKLLHQDLNEMLVDWGLRRTRLRLA